LSTLLNSEEGAPIPAQVAETVIGQRFSSFSKMREAVWKLVAEIPELARDFTEDNRRLMRSGSAPYPPDSEQVAIRGTDRRSRHTWELHHNPSIGQGGEVYDLSAIRVATPKQHDNFSNKGNTK
jgi:hypothetical protein